MIRLKAAGDSLFISGATALPLFHQHSHENDEVDPSEDISTSAWNYHSRKLRVGSDGGQRLSVASSSSRASLCGLRIA